MIKTLLNKLICFFKHHDYKLVSHGKHEYQKGNREVFAMYGRLYKCSRCPAEKFIPEV